MCLSTEQSRISSLGEGGGVHRSASKEACVVPPPPLTQMHRLTWSPAKTMASLKSQTHYDNDTPYHCAAARATTSSMQAAGHVIASSGAKNLSPPKPSVPPDGCVKLNKCSRGRAANAMSTAS